MRYFGFHFSAPALCYTQFYLDCMTLALLTWRPALGVPEIPATGPPGAGVVGPESECAHCCSSCCDSNLFFRWFYGLVFLLWRALFYSDYMNIISYFKNRCRCVAGGYIAVFRDDLPHMDVPASARIRCHALFGHAPIGDPKGTIASFSAHLLVFLSVSA